jgi:anti-sigma factor RsiW
MADDDAELVALIDNELDESRTTALLARLAADERLRQRYEEFRQTGAPLAASLDKLLTQAPLARLRAALSVGSPVRQPRIALRNLAAVITIGILAAGAAVWVALSLGLLRERQDWRTAVVEYTNLYTNETFSPLNPDASLQAIELSALGARVGVNLTPESVALPGDSRRRSCSRTMARRWAWSPTSIPRARRSCFASSPMVRRTPRCARSAETICRSPGGRAADGAVW